MLPAAPRRPEENALKAPSRERPADERRILVAAPTGNDAVLTAHVLAQARLSVQICQGVDDVCREVEGDCGAILLAEETLKATSVPQLVATLGRQPAWSDVPVIIITSGGEADQARLRRLAAFGPGSNVTLLERPFRPGTLISTMEVALRSRMRQYQVRDLLGEVSLARDASEQANRAKDDFLAALSHELRTPLNPVLLLATEAAANRAIEPELRADFATIAKNVMLEARLIDDLLDLTRITRGKLVLDSRPTALHGVLRDAIANVNADVAEKQLSLKVEFCEGDPIVDGDPVRLQQVFWNVLKNAAKFTPSQGQIVVKTSQASPAGRVLIEISDTGVGMAAAEIGRIFEAFTQGDHASRAGSHQFGGLGLGLAISRSLIELHAGSIRASSPGLGLGSTFHIELPLTASPSSATSGPEAARTLPSGAVRTAARMHILLVEDHEPTRTVLAHLLRERKHTVAVASSVAEARELGLSQDFDLMITDIGLPDGDGYELMETLGRRRGLRGIALTGYGGETDAARSEKAGFIGHLVKPVSMLTLDAVLGSLSVPADVR
jgi:signal transduction histidine kinase